MEGQPPTHFTAFDLGDLSLAPVSGALCVLPEWIGGTTSFSIAIPKEASKGSRNEEIETTKGLDEG